MIYSFISLNFCACLDVGRAIDYSAVLCKLDVANLVSPLVKILFWIFFLSPHHFLTSFLFSSFVHRYTTVITTYYCFAGWSCIFFSCLISWVTWVFILNMFAWIPTVLWGVWQQFPHFAKLSQISFVCNPENIFFINFFCGIFFMWPLPLVLSCGLYRWCWSWLSQYSYMTWQCLKRLLFRD